MALEQAERASKLSSAMQLVVEIEREKDRPQRTQLVWAVEAALADFVPLAESGGINIIRREMADCEIAVSRKALSTALFLLLDRVFGWAKGGDVLHVEINDGDCEAQFDLRIVRQGDPLQSIEESELVILRSIFRALGAQLSAHMADKSIELHLTFPIVTEM